MHEHRLAGVALQAQHDLLRRLRLLVEHGLGLTTETTLLAVVATLACKRECMETTGGAGVSESATARDAKKAAMTGNRDCARCRAVRTPASTLNAMGDAQRGRATRLRVFATRLRAIARVGIARIQTVRLASFHRSRRVSSVRFRALALARHRGEKRSASRERRCRGTHPARKERPCPSCTASPCEACASCTSCRSSSWPWGCSPASRRAGRRVSGRSRHRVRGKALGERKRAFGPPRRAPGGPRRRERRARTRDARSAT